MLDVLRYTIFVKYSDLMVAVKQELSKAMVLHKVLWLHTIHAFCVMIFLFHGSEGGKTPLTIKDVEQRLLVSLQQDIPTLWTYKDAFRHRKELMLDQGLIDRSIRHLSRRNRLKQLFSLAEQGFNIDVSVIGGSVSRGQPFVQRGQGRRVYHYALKDWWNKIVQPITGSKMTIRDYSIGGVGSEYFANCLPVHLAKEYNTNLILWELSGNDVARYRGVVANVSQPLEQFLRNALRYRSQPEILLLNFFNGNDFLSKRGCHDLDMDGETPVAQYYDVTELSWTRSVCPYLMRDESGMAFEYLFSNDHFHPSIAAHAQMAYILIEHIRDQFVKSLLNGSSQKKINIKSTLPTPMFDQTYTGTPLCYSLLKVDDAEPLNTLRVVIVSSPKYSLSTYKSFVHRGDTLQGLQTKSENEIITFRFAVPSYAAVLPFKKLTVLSFAKSGDALSQLDSRPVISLQTSKYSALGTIEMIAARNVGPGEHQLRIWSKRGGFLILALMLS